MTKAEMTEIFAVMRLNYRHAKMFEGGMESLAPTIKLWTAALPEVDYWTGQKALMSVLRTCKYPPTIAEFKEAADAVSRKVQRQIDDSIAMLRVHAMASNSTIEEICAEQAPGTLIQLAITEIGGPSAMNKDNPRRWEQFSDAYYRVLQKQSPARANIALPGTRKELP